MVEQYHAQVRELMTHYGKIDVLWYDGHWVNVEGKTLAQFWKSKTINAEVRKLQPHIIINNRSGVDEDIDTPEQHVTASKAGRGWESCMTIGDSCGWGYIKNNPNFKTEPQLLQNLVTAAAGEGNYLLNVGPKPNGTIRKKERKRLETLGDWLDRHGEAIYGSERCELDPGMLGLWTAQGHTGYFHIFRWPGTEAVAPLVKSKAVSATLLTNGQDVSIRQERNGRLVLGDLPKKAPDKNVSVIKVEFEGAPQAKRERNKASWLKGRA
jgi:alpha-L-fucosidase